MIDFKQGLLRKAAHAFLVDSAHTDRRAFDTFCQSNSDWLDDYALFMACKRVYKDAAWVYWDAGIRRRDSAVLREWRDQLSSETEIHKFAQFEFFRQWEKLRAHSSRFRRSTGLFQRNRSTLGKPSLSVGRVCYFWSPVVD